MICAGTEDTIINCYYNPVFVAEEDRGLFNISGVSCLRTPPIPVTSTSPQSNKQTDNNSDNFTTMSIIVALLVIMLIISVAITIGLVSYINYSGGTSEQRTHY